MLILKESSHGLAEIILFSCVYFATRTVALHETTIITIVLHKPVYIFNMSIETSSLGFLDMEMSKCISGCGCSRNINHHDNGCATRASPCRIMSRRLLYVHTPRLMHPSKGESWGVLVLVIMEVTGARNFDHQRVSLWSARQLQVCLLLAGWRRGRGRKEGTYTS